MTTCTPAAAGVTTTDDASASGMATSIVRRQARPLALSFGCAIAGTVLALVQPIFLSSVVAELEHGTAAIRTALLLLLAVTAGEAVCEGAQRFYLCRAGVEIIHGLRSRLFPRILGWPLGRHMNVTTGHLVSLVTSDSQRIHHVIVEGVFEIVIASLTMLGALVMMGFLSPVLLGVTLAAVVVAFVVLVLVAGATRTMSARVQALMDAMVGEFGASLRAMRTLIAGGAAGRRAELLVELSGDVRDADLALGRRLAVINPLVGVAVQMTFVAVLLAGGVLVARGQLALSDLLAFLMYVFLLLMPLESALRAVPAIQQARASWERVGRALDVPTEAEADRQVALASVPQTPIVEDQAIALRGVTFEYEPGVPILDGVDLSVERGERVAVVGSSGAGKSTLLALLLRLIDPTDGTLAIAGDRVDRVPRSRIRSRISYLEQNAPIIGGSVAENLRLFSPHATDDTLARALREVGLERLLERGAGLDEHVGADGVRLSGGEGQRLALARTLIDPAEIVLVDEPTSQVDAATEHLIMRRLAALPTDVTVVVLAHRLNTVTDFDRIIVLDAGRVVGTGRHEELLRTCPTYSTFARLQSVA